MALCRFYDLQSKLQALGWYVEWSYASQENHVFEDMPTHHEVGPFAGEKIDEGKVLVSFIGDCDEYKVPEGMSDDDLFDWHECVVGALAVGPSDLEQYLEQFVHQKLPFPTPEGWGGNEFIGPSEEIIEEVILPVAEACGCRVKTGDGSCWIEWGDLDASKRFYPQRKYSGYYEKRNFAQSVKGQKLASSDSFQDKPLSDVEEKIDRMYGFTRIQFGDGEEVICSDALGRHFPSDIEDSKICDEVSDEELMMMAKGKWAPDLWHLSTYQDPRAARAITHLTKRLSKGRSKKDFWRGDRGDYERNIAQNPATSSAALKMLVEGGFGSAFKEKWLDIMSHPNCNLSVWRAFAEREFPEDWIVNHPACPPSILKRLNNDR